MSLKPRLPYLSKVVFTLILVFDTYASAAQLDVTLSYFNFSAELKKEAEDIFNIGNAITDYDEFLSAHFYYRGSSLNYLLNIDINDEFKPKQFTLGVGKSFGPFDINAVLQKRQFLYVASTGINYLSNTVEVPVLQFGITSYWQYQYQLAHIGASMSLLYGQSPNEENQHLITSTITNFRFLFEEKYKFKQVLSYQFAIELGLKLASFKTKELTFFYEYAFRADSFNFINVVDRHDLMYGNKSFYKEVNAKNTYLQNQNRIGLILQ
jgi:hypothetical protein